MKLPYGAQKIIELRKAGKRPADMVLISLAGSLRGENNPVVILTQPDVDYRFLRDLEVMIVCTMQTPRELLKRVADEVIAVAPAYAGIWWKDKVDGLNLCWGNYRPKAKFMRRWSPSERAAYASH